MQNSAKCKHCGRILPFEYQDNSENEYRLYQKYDPTVMKIGQVVTIITAVLLVYSFLGDVGYQITHMFPKVTREFSQEVNPAVECVQENLKSPSQITIGQGRTHRLLIKQAKYTLSGIVVARNTNFWLRTFMQNDFDEVVPIDFGIAWGKLADKKLLSEHFKFKSFKTLGEARVLSYKWRGVYHLDSSYIHSHISHNHLIPANDNVAAALLKVKKWDKVKLEGYLVDMIFPNGQTSYTSLTRTDTNPTSRGNGACETFYVEAIQIGKKYYK